MNINLITIALILVLVADVALAVTGRLSQVVAVMFGVIVIALLIITSGVIK